MRLFQHPLGRWRKVLYGITALGRRRLRPQSASDCEEGLSLSRQRAGLAGHLARLSQRRAAATWIGRLHDAVLTRGHTVYDAVGILTRRERIGVESVVRRGVLRGGRGRLEMLWGGVIWLLLEHGLRVGVAGGHGGWRITSASEWARVADMSDGRLGDLSAVCACTAPAKGRGPGDRRESEGLCSGRSGDRRFLLLLLLLFLLRRRRRRRRRLLQLVVLVVVVLLLLLQVLAGQRVRCHGSCHV
jgi:hypothetical protein